MHRVDAAYALTRWQHFSQTFNSNCHTVDNCVGIGDRKNVHMGQNPLQFFSFPDTDTSRFSRSYCTQYDRLLASYCCVCRFVCPSVTLWIVAKRYMLHKKCLNKWIGSAVLGTRLYNLQTLTHLSHHTPPPKKKIIFQHSTKKNACITWSTLCSRDAHADYVILLILSNQNFWASCTLLLSHIFRYFSYSTLAYSAWNSSEQCSTVMKLRPYNIPERTD